MPQKNGHRDVHFWGQLCMLRFCLFLFYMDVVVSLQCLSSTSAGATNDVALLLGTTAHFATRLNRNLTTLLTAHTPLFKINGGPSLAGQETSAVAFDTNAHFLDAGNQGMQIGTHGFTAIAVVMFTDIVVMTPGSGSWGAIFDFGNGWNERINITRYQETQHLIFNLVNTENDKCLIMCRNCIVQNKWQTMVAQYDPVSLMLSLSMGGIAAEPIRCGSKRVDRTFSKMYLGNNQVSRRDEMLGKIAGFFAVDKFLSIHENNDIIEGMYSNKDPFEVWLSCSIAATDKRSSNPAFKCLCNSTSNLQEFSCIAGSPSPLVETNAEVALLRGTTRFESRLNRFSIARDDSGIALFENTGGPGPTGQETSAVVFNLDSHLLNAGRLQMKIGSNGFTAVAVVMFTGISNWQRIFEFGILADTSNNLQVIRSGTTNSLRFVIRNGINDVCFMTCNDCIEQDRWQTLVAQYNPTESQLTVRMGDKTQSSACNWRRNRTFEKMNLGSNPSKIAGFYAVDKFLSKQEVSAIIDDIYLNNDPFDAWCGHDCKPGYSIDRITMTCKLCPLELPINPSLISGHYCNGCVISLTDQRSLDPAYACFCDGVSNLQQCSCAPGYIGDGSTCTAASQCPAKNTIAFVEHSTIHRNASTVCRCTTNTHSVYDAGVQKSDESCKCKGGWTDWLQDNTPAVSWVDGSPFVENQITECRRCASGKYSVMGGECLACTHNVCHSCGDNSHWDPSSTSCKCDIAFGRTHGYLCQMCQAGKYSRVAGNNICLSCASDRYSLDQATSCDSPPLNSVVNSDQSGFSCNNAYALNDSLTDPCQLIPVDTCPAGKFLHRRICYDCVQGTYKEAEGAHDCVACQTHSTSTIGSKLQSACTCNAGFSSKDNNVASAASLVSCIKCGIGTDTQSAGGTCEPCAASIDASVLTNALSGKAQMPGCIEFV